jgi:hypothetical protein
MSSAVLERQPVDYWLPSEDADDVDLSTDTGDEPTSEANSRSNADDSGRAARKKFARSLSLRRQFDLLADELAADTVGVSSSRRLVAHPSFGGILMMGAEAIPFLIERVESGEHRPTWLKILGSLTSLPPSAGQETIDDSAEAWIRWARSSPR